MERHAFTQDAEEYCWSNRHHQPYADPNYPFWGIILGAVYGGVFYWGIDQVNVQRVLGAKNLREARFGSMFAILLKFTPVFIFALPGVIAAVLFPGRDSKTTFVTLLNELLPIGVRGLVLAALLSALIGSSLAVMNSVSTLVVRDFLLYFKKDTSERLQVLIGRVAIVLSTPLAITAAYLIYTTPDGLYKYLQAISIYLSAAASAQSGMPNFTPHQLFQMPIVRSPTAGTILGSMATRDCSISCTMGKNILIF